MPEETVKWEGERKIHAAEKVEMESERKSHAEEKVKWEGQKERRGEEGGRARRRGGGRIGH